MPVPLFVARWQFITVCKSTCAYLNAPMMGSDKLQAQKRGEEAFPTILQALHVLHTQPEPSTVEIGQELDELAVCARPLCVFVRV